MLSQDEGKEAAFIILLQLLSSHSWRLHNSQAAYTQSSPSVSFPCFLTYWSRFVFTAITHTACARKQMSNQHLCLCSFWIGHNLLSWVCPVVEKSESPFEITKINMSLRFNRKLRGRRLIYRKLFQFHKWPVAVRIVYYFDWAKFCSSFYREQWSHRHVWSYILMLW